SCSLISLLYYPGMHSYCPKPAPTLVYGDTAPPLLVTPSTSKDALYSLESLLPTPPPTCAPFRFSSRLIASLTCLPIARPYSQSLSCKGRSLSTEIPPICGVRYQCPTSSAACAANGAASTQTIAMFFIDTPFHFLEINRLHDGAPAACRARSVDTVQSGTYSIPIPRGAFLSLWRRAPA